MRSTRGLGAAATAFLAGLFPVSSGPATAQVPRIDPRPAPAAAVELCQMAIDQGVAAVHAELQRLEWDLDERTIATLGPSVTVLRAGEFDWRGAHTLRIEVVDYPTQTEFYCSFETDQWTPEAGIELAVVAGYGMEGQIDALAAGAEGGFLRYLAPAGR